MVKHRVAEISPFGRYKDNSLEFANVGYAQ